MVVGASITVNNSRNSGNLQTGLIAEDTILLKKIHNELKKMNRQNTVASRKSESGFGAGATTSYLSTLLKGSGSLLGVFGGLLGLGGMEGSTNSAATGSANQPVSYLRFREGADGENQYAQIDRKTGDVLRVLTEEEAERMGILDNLGNIKGYLSDQEANSKSAFASSTNVAGTYELSAKKLEEILASETLIEGVTADILRLMKREKRAQREITKAKERRAKQKAGAEPGEIPNEQDPNAVVDIIFGGVNPVSRPGDQTSRNIMENRELDNQYINPNDPSLPGGLQ